MLTMLYWILLLPLFFNTQNGSDKTILITMQGMKFSPDKIEISAGTTVIWRNASTTLHNVVANDKGFKSELLKKGETFQYTFMQTGTFAYYCKPHRMMGMKGMITVK